MELAPSSSGKGSEFSGRGAQKRAEQKPSNAWLQSPSPYGRMDDEEDVATAAPLTSTSE